MKCELERIDSRLLNVDDLLGYEASSTDVVSSQTTLVRHIPHIFHTEMYIT